MFFTLATSAMAIDEVNEKIIIEYSNDEMFQQLMIDDFNSAMPC